MLSTNEHSAIAGLNTFSCYVQSRGLDQQRGMFALCIVRVLFDAWEWFKDPVAFLLPVNDCVKLRFVTLWWEAPPPHTL